MKKNNTVLFFIFWFGFVFSLLFTREAIADGTLRVTVRNGNLSVVAKGIPLVQILKRIAQQTQIQVFGEPHIAAIKISTDIHDLSLEAGLKKMLSGHNVVFAFPDKKNPPALDTHQGQPPIQVWILQKGDKNVSPTTPGLHLVNLTQHQDASPDPTPNAATKEKQEQIAHLLVALNDPDRATRMAVLNELNNMGNDVSADLFAKVILDSPYPDLRMAAVLTSNIPLPPEALARMARSDPSPEIRVEALYAMEELTQVVPLVKELQNDLNPIVRDVAREIMEMRGEEGMPGSEDTPDDPGNKESE